MRDIIFYIGMIVLLTVMNLFHEQVRANICEYFNGEVIDKNFYYVECRSEKNDLKILADSLNDVANFIWIGMWLIFFLFGMLYFAGR